MDRQKIRRAFMCQEGLIFTVMFTLIFILTNLTRVGMYFLLETELITVSTSNLRPIDEDSEWEITHYPFKEISELDMELVEYTNESDYESGTLYIKFINDKEAERTHVLRNLNPKHFQCFKDFHVNSMEKKYI